MSKTRAAAFEEIKYKAPSLRSRILDCLANCGALNTAEIAKRIYQPYESVGPRITELKDLDLIRDSGCTRIGRTKQGALWILNPNPRPAPKKKLKPIGDKVLFGEMMRCIYACAAADDLVNRDNLVTATDAWAFDMVKRLK